MLLIACVAVPAAADDFASDPSVLAIFANIIRRGSFGMGDLEAAAFVVRKRDGSYGCLLWPSNGEFRAAHYPSPPPSGAVAIVHTHPLSLPFPSPQDRQTAKHLGIPIYALTFTSIYKADISGEVVLIDRSRRWDAAIKARDVCSSFDDDQPPQDANLDLVDVCDGRIAITGLGADASCDF